MESWLPVLVPLLFLVVFPLFWSGIVSLMAWLGWRRLARRFATDRKPPQRLSTWTSGRIGIANYKSVLNVGAGPDGLYLSVFALFRPGHPPLLIPWSAVQHAEVKNWLFTPYLHLTIDTLPPTAIRLPARALREAEQWLPAVPAPSTAHP